MGLLSMLLGDQNPAAQFVADNRNTIRGIGAGLASGPTFATGLSNAVQMGAQGGPMDDVARLQRKQAEEQAKQKTATQQWLAQKFPDLAQMVDAGMPISEAWQTATQRMQPQAPTDPTSTASGRQQLAAQYGLTGADAQMYVLTGKLPGANDSAKFGFTPIPVVDANGNYQLIQPGSDGTPNVMQLPEGYRYDPSAVTQDKAYGTEVGKGIGGQATTAAGDINNANMALDLIGQIKSSPELGWATGATALLNKVPGTGRYDFQALVDQAKGGAFLNAVQQMRGLGALSEAEGRAATAAIARMDTSQTKEGFVKALDDYEAIIRRGAAKAQARASGDTSLNPTGATVNSTTGGVKWSIE